MIIHKYYYTYIFVFLVSSGYIGKSLGFTSLESCSSLANTTGIAVNKMPLVTI